MTVYIRNALTGALVTSAVHVTSADFCFFLLWYEFIDVTYIQQISRLPGLDPSQLVISRFMF
jgi:hypothetical protein